jgi:hypothetical protein
VGNFYVNFTVKDTEQKPVAEILQRAGRSAFIAPPQDGCVVVYDEAAEAQAEETIHEVGTLLSSATGQPVVAFLNHDDDILCYWLFEGGEATDSYNSNPDYFSDDDPEPESIEQGGDVERLCTALRSGADRAAVDALLREDHIFAVEKHKKLAEALGIPTCSVGFGWSSAARGELRHVLGPELAEQVLCVGRRSG